MADAGSALVGTAALAGMAAGTLADAAGGGSSGANPGSFKMEAAHATPAANRAATLSVVSPTRYQLARIHRRANIDTPPGALALWRFAPAVSG